MIRPWQKLNSRVAFQKYAMRIEQWDFRQPSGKETDYYVRVSPDGACVLGITEDNKVVTVRQYRPGPDTIFNELPGGMVEKGEDPIQAAIREFREETGYEGEVQGSGSYFEDAYTARMRYWVVITKCRKVTEQVLDDTEFAEVKLVNLPDFITQARKGEMTDAAAAMLGLDYLNLLH